MVVAVQHSETIADAQATFQETLHRISMHSLPHTVANVTPHPIPVRVIAKDSDIPAISHCSLAMENGLTHRRNKNLSTQFVKRTNCGSSGAESP